MGGVARSGRQHAGHEHGARHTHGADATVFGETEAADGRRHDEDERGITPHREVIARYVMHNPDGDEDGPHYDDEEEDDMGR